MNFSTEYFLALAALHPASKNLPPPTERELINLRRIDSFTTVYLSLSSLIFSERSCIF